MAKEFDTRKRLTSVLQSRIRLKQQEHALAKQLAKLHNNMASVLQNVRRQQRELCKLNAITNQHDDYIEKRNTFEQALRDKLFNEEQNCSELVAQLAQKKNERDELIAYVRTVSEATNTYINTKVLPERLKGIAVNPNGGQWVPFDFDAHNLSGFNALWSCMHKPGANDSAWQQLFSPDTTSLPTANENENPNVSMTSIIEIDLTSPSADK